jgi:TonB family protein
LRRKKGGDQSALRTRLDALAIPNANDWIATHFSLADVPKIQRDYPLSLAGFQRHLSWVIEDAARLPGWEMVVKPSELPKPPATSGPEAEIPLPTQTIAVENFRYGPAHPEDPPDRSWVNSFVYFEGCFRYVGGTYPFWGEGLQQIRRPQAGPFGVKAARIVHKVSPEYPKKARKQHVEGVVRLRAIIGKDGAPRELEVVSGDPLLTDAALKAVRQWRYEPTLLLGKPDEVDTTIDVIFALNH